MTLAWFLLGQAFRPGDARAYGDSRVNRDAARTAHPFGWTDHYAPASPAVWARASIGTLRTALVIAARGPSAAAPSPAGAPGDPLRACFAALQRGNDGPGDMRLR